MQIEVAETIVICDSEFFNSEIHERYFSDYFADWRDGEYFPRWPIYFDDPGVPQIATEKYGSFLRAAFCYGYNWVNILRIVNEEIDADMEEYIATSPPVEKITPYLPWWNYGVYDDVIIFGDHPRDKNRLDDLVKRLVKMADEVEHSRAVEILRKMLPREKTIYTLLRYETKSGMARDISFFIIWEGKIACIDYLVRHALDLPWGKNRNGLRIRGYGMDYGWYVVYSLSHMLHDDGYVLTQRRI